MSPTHKEQILKVARSIEAFSDDAVPPPGPSALAGWATTLRKICQTLPEDAPAATEKTVPPRTLAPKKKPGPRFTF